MWTFCPKPVARLRSTDPLVYYYLAYRHRWGNIPTVSVVTWATGLCRNTVSASLDRLEDVGAVCDGEPVYLPEWFLSRMSNDGHWSQTLQYWRCLVRAEGSPLSVSDVMVYSYLLHRSATTQPHRWSHAYVGMVLCLDARTVSQALANLEQHGLFRIIDGRWCVADTLVGPQQDWLRRKEASHSGSTSLGTFTPTLDDVVQPTADVPAASHGDDLGAIAMYVKEQVENPALQQRIYHAAKSVARNGGDWQKMVDAEIARHQKMVAETSPSDEKIDDDPLLRELEAMS